METGNDATYTHTHHKAVVLRSCPENISISDLTAVVYYTDRLKELKKLVGYVFMSYVW